MINASPMPDIFLVKRFSKRKRISLPNSEYETKFLSPLFSKRCARTASVQCRNKKNWVHKICAVVLLIWTT